MLQMYLASVFIWVIIIYATTTLCAGKIVANGWLDNATPSGSNRGLVILFTVAAIPILRLLMVIVLIALSSMTPEKYEEWRDHIDK